MERRRFLVEAAGLAIGSLTVLIKAGNLFDARNGRMLTNQGILIEGDPIKKGGNSAVIAGHAPAPK